MHISHLSTPTGYVKIRSHDLLLQISSIRQRSMVKQGYSFWLLLPQRSSFSDVNRLRLYFDSTESTEA